MRATKSVWLGLAALVFSAETFAATVEFTDPRGDDNGPGTYTYPTDAAYKKGAFDLTSMKITEKGSNVEFTVEIAIPFDDPWDSKKWPTPGNGFSVQMFQIYIDADNKAGSGHVEALPGMNASFADTDRWEKVVVISPQSNARLSTELDQHAKDLVKDVVLPKQVRPRGREVTAVVAKRDLGNIDLKKAGFQVLVSSNEGFPTGKNVLARQVNEYEGAHRFGGGDDSDINANVMDIFAGEARGAPSEMASQHDLLKYDVEKKKRPVLTMVRSKK